VKKKKKKVVAAVWKQCVTADCVTAIKGLPLLENHYSGTEFACIFKKIVQVHYLNKLQQFIEYAIFNSCTARRDGSQCDIRAHKVSDTL